jgi:serine/threonine-protein kinase
MTVPRFGSFEVKQELARGPFGQVYLAVDPVQGWHVVIKAFAIEPNAQPDDRAAWAARVLREARHAADFHHTHLVPIHGIYTLDDGTPYLVRDYIHGRSLWEWSQDGSASTGTRLGWLLDFAKVLSAIHGSGRLHRCVKPHNALVRKDGKLFALDFGVAHRSLDRAAGLARPTAQVLVRRPEPPLVHGTPAYMAPEQLGHQPVGAAADQFGWGVTAFEVLTGTLPWGADRKPVRLIEAILTRPAPRLTDLRPDIPEAVEELVLRCLRKDAAGRFASMNDVVSALTQACAS